MALTLLVALVIASMIHPSSAWAFVFQISLVLTLIAMLVRGLFHAHWNYALHGFMIGGGATLLLCLLPIPFWNIVEFLKGKVYFYDDLNLISIAILGILPLIGAVIGSLIPRLPGQDEDADG